jgi:hypothetical protein
MIEPMKCSRGRWSRDRAAAIILTGMVLLGGVALVSPGTASASGRLTPLHSRAPTVGRLSSHLRPLTALSVRRTVARGTS